MDYVKLHYTKLVTKHKKNIISYKIINIFNEKAY